MYLVILWQTGFCWILCILPYFVKVKFYNGLHRANNSVVKECFCNIRYDIRFRKLCLDHDVIDRDCLRYDISSKFKSVCRL